MSHKVLFHIPNPFKKKYPYEPTGPQLVWLTRCWYSKLDGRDIPGTRYLLLLYGFDGRVKRHFELDVFDRQSPG